MALKTVCKPPTAANEIPLSELAALYSVACCSAVSSSVLDH